MAEFHENSRRACFYAAERKRAVLRNKLHYKPRKYPAVQPRGYYSDIVTHEAKRKSDQIVEEGPNVYRSKTWNVPTEKYTPNVFKLQFTTEEIEKQLENQIYGPDTGVFTKKRVAGESCVSGVDFSPLSFLPKVQLAIGHKPGQKPRNIEVERLRRLYARLDLHTLLKERGIDTNLLMPKQQSNLNVILMQDPNDPAPFPPYLPMALFDNTDFDCCTPEEWMKLGETTLAIRPTPAVCLLPVVDSDKYKDPTDPSITYQWFDAGVLDYDAKKNMYYIQKVDDNCRILDLEGNPVINKSIDPITGKRIELPNQFWVERWRCMFRAEDPRIFADRINFCFRSRKRCEAELRYTLYVDCMPMDGLGELSPQNVASIEWRVNSTVKLAQTKRNQDCAKKVMKEVSVQYCWVMNKFILDEEVRKNPATLAFVTQPTEHGMEVPACGKVEVPAYNFHRQSDNFAYASIYTAKKSVTAMRLVRAECNSILSNIHFFNFKMNKIFKLEEFEILQYQTVTIASNYLREIWVNNLKLHIRKSFMNVQRGWFNIYEENWHIYQISKMKKLMEVVKLIMQDTLRFMVMDGLQCLTKHILDYCYSTLHVRKFYTWGKSYIDSPFPPRRIPTLFTIDLILDSKVHYNTDLTRIAVVMDNIFLSAINGAENILQLEKLIMQEIFWAETPVLEAVSIHEGPVQALREIIKDAIECSLIPVNAYAQKYEPFLEVINMDIKQYTKEVEEKCPTAKLIEREVNMHLMERDRIFELLPYNIIIGPFFVNLELVRDQIAAKRQEIASAVLTLLAKRIRTNVDGMTDEFREIMGTITETPNCIESLFALREWINEMQTNMYKSKDRINVLLADFEVLDSYCYNLTDDDFIAKTNLIAWPNRVEQTIEKKLEVLEIDEDRYLKQLDSDTFILNERIDNAQINVAAMAEFHDMQKVHEYANEMRRMAKNLRECQDLSALYNSREKLFKMKPTNYARLGKLTKEFEPFRKLWMTASDWQRWHESWLTDPLSAINSEELERCVTESYKTMHKFSRFFASIPAVQDVAIFIRGNIEAFKPYVPLIQAMTNPGLKERHWELLSEACNMKLRPSPTLTFTKCLEMGLDAFTEPISKISDVAAKEYAIELSLNKMEADWENMEFDVLAYRNSGTYMLKAGEEISQQIDDHIVLTQSMTFSPYKKPFEERISEWEEKLKLAQEVLEEWLNVQRSWLYLEPIFSSDDITKQLPTESSRFQTMGRIWRKVMRNAKATPQVIQVCPDETLLSDLKKCGELLDHVQKGLSDYLETKRSRFPRFFFLSDDELLEILSQTKDPTAVQPHLRKCFENINWLKFEKDNRISHMRSGEGETVELCEELYPFGNVEDWLSEIERVMRATVRHVISLAIPDYLQMARTEWVLKWPGQVVIAVCQMYWSAEVAKALGDKEIPQYFDKMLEQLEGLRNLVRQDISRIGRMTLSALIVIEVHARDVVETLVNEGIQDPNAFEWISQLRYYWLPDHNLYQRAVNAEFPYCYEYLGNSPRLVITPLTDRCYLTLTGALNLLFGGAPAGPAGTGKTETTKDLAKAFAIQCVVFNCSDQLDFMAMGKFFKGLASSGAWACFDEFNRIDIEVLSVVAQQIATIQNAQRMKVDTFNFEGLEIALKISCAVFITMNPGYAGRTELPDNLKVCTIVRF